MTAAMVVVAHGGDGSGGDGGGDGKKDLKKTTAEKEEGPHVMVYYLQ
jgi:hypothetical protein